MNILKTNRGYSLIQVLVGAALLSMLAMAFATLIKDMWLENRSLQTKSNELNLFQTIGAELSSEATCTTALDRTVPFDPAQPSRPLRMSLKSETVVATGDLKSWDLKINSFRLNSINLAIASTSGKSTYLGDLEIQAESTVGRKMVYKNKNIGKLFLVVDDATRMIESCYASPDQGDIVGTVCRSLGGTMNGSVCTLDVLRRESLARLGTCPPGQVVIGTTPSGSLDCQTPANKLAAAGTCPGGTTVAGFNGSGGVYCAPNPQAPPNPPPKVCTSVGGNCCPGGNGRCASTGNVTQHTGSGGRGGYDTSYPNNTCFCN